MKNNEVTPNVRMQNGWLWKTASGQAQSKSLEWIPWGVLEYGRIQLKKRIQV